jgi:hypothetical protein
VHKKLEMLQCSMYLKVRKTNAVPPCRLQH